MSKIKQAREDVQAYFDGVNCDPAAIIFKIHGQTILTALSALERMQGVDFDELNSAFAIEEEQNTMYKINLITEFKKIYKRMPTVTYRNAARIVADIGKDI